MKPGHLVQAGNIEDTKSGQIFHVAVLLMRGRWDFCPYSSVRALVEKKNSSRPHTTIPTNNPGTTLDSR